MPSIYAMSDIHGEVDAFLEALALVDFTCPQTRLVLLGDYIDHHFEKPEIYFLLMDLQRKYPQQVVFLLGNVDEFYLESLRCQGVLGSDPASQRIARWIAGLPRYYETDWQIFVHAGVDEEAGDLWRCGTEDSVFTGKFPPTTGTFEKDIIAGHVGTGSEYLADDPAFHEVFWDGESHYFLDGSSEFSHRIPLLRFDTDTGAYYTFVPAEDGWREQAVVPFRR